MSGWGEAKGPSAEMVERAEERRKADALADVVAAYLACPTTGNGTRLAVAHASYEKARGPRARAVISGGRTDA